MRPTSKYCLMLAILVLSMATKSSAQLPLTIEKMEKMCSMSEAEFISAMKDYPAYKEKTAWKKENKCYYYYPSKDSELLIGHTFYKSNTIVEMATFSIHVMPPKEVDAFISSIISSGYTENLDSIYIKTKIRSFQKGSFHMTIQTSDPAHKTISLLARTPKSIAITPTPK